MLSAATSLFLPQEACAPRRLSTIAKALNTGRNKSDKQKSYHAFHSKFFLVFLLMMYFLMGRCTALLPLPCEPLGPRKYSQGDNRSTFFLLCIFPLQLPN